jgi:hypothetical protein
MTPTESPDPDDPPSAAAARELDRSTDQQRLTGVRQTRNARRRNVTARTPSPVSCRAGGPKLRW